MKMSRAQEKMLRLMLDTEKDKRGSSKYLQLNQRVLETLYARGWAEHAPRCVPGMVALTPRGRAALEEREAEWRDLWKELKEGNGVEG